MKVKPFIKSDLYPTGVNFFRPDPSGNLDHASNQESPPRL
jgi:hypothetical protein